MCYGHTAQLTKHPSGPHLSILVFGLDAILPIEFLVPTLRVAKSLNWTGHELSDRIDHLEKLDETRLQAIAGMYAEKRRQK